ncbi:type II toxin-antitoxin system RelE family toxin [Saccharopolyspora spinosa]|uniref:mRNA-degrading endonuclease RelE of RelBE toxin-antitoxin system n=1 Tax=Saccharopolyspora spinosa TaxID=60894 RepID=A0A2N3XQ03_SACSN|nr:type II toxin-antitoxin system RelE/ParE family toxin [Saccharopolyspora spinosa]PKW12766.1 mRNA-degrading endonuclease RelE of RelBE toxin-antitoxin system [Saccharopolyspora spinosa]
MTYTIKITARAGRDLALLPEKVAAACAEFIFGPLAESPHRLGKPLFGEFKGLHSARRSAYRVVYAIQDDTVVVEVVRIAHRADVYR